MNKSVEYNIEELTDKSMARRVKADFENEAENFTHDLKVYLSYKEYEAVIEIAEILNKYKKAINDIDKKFKL